MSKFFSAVDAIISKPGLKICQDVYLEQMYITRQRAFVDVLNFKKDTFGHNINFTLYPQFDTHKPLGYYKIYVKRYLVEKAAIIVIDNKPEIALDNITINGIMNMTEEVSRGEFFFYHFSQNLQMFGEPEECKISLKLFHGGNYV